MQALHPRSDLPQGTISDCALCTSKSPWLGFRWHTTRAHLSQHKWPHLAHVRADFLVPRAFLFRPAESLDPRPGRERRLGRGHAWRWGPPTHCLPARALQRHTCPHTRPKQPSAALPADEHKASSWRTAPPRLRPTPTLVAASLGRKRLRCGVGPRTDSRRDTLSHSRVSLAAAGGQRLGAPLRRIRAARPAPALFLTSLQTKVAGRCFYLRERDAC
jgi:hypothetical protein